MKSIRVPTKEEELFRTLTIRDGLVILLFSGVNVSLMMSAALELINSKLRTGAAGI